MLAGVKQKQSAKLYPNLELEARTGCSRSIRHRFQLGFIGFDGRHKASEARRCR